MFYILIVIPFRSHFIVIKSFTLFWHFDKKNDLPFVAEKNICLTARPLATNVCTTRPLWKKRAKFKHRYESEKNIHKKGLFTFCNSLPHWLIGPYLPKVLTKTGLGIWIPSHSFLKQTWLYCFHENEEYPRDHWSVSTMKAEIMGTERNNFLFMFFHLLLMLLYFL